MYILTQTEPLENCKEKILHVQIAEDIEKRYLDAGYEKTGRIYKLTDKGKDYTIVCIEFRNDVKGSSPDIFVPEFYVLGRPYPIYVYLYSIDLYSRLPDMGQRQAAEETRGHFKLATFAHTTLGRALKAFVRITSGAGSESTDKPRGDKPRGLPSTKSTVPMRRRAAEFLNGILSGATWRQAAAICCELARKWYRDNQVFLL